MGCNGIQIDRSAMCFFWGYPPWKRSHIPDPKTPSISMIFPTSRLAGNVSFKGNQILLKLAQDGNLEMFRGVLGSTPPISLEEEMSKVNGKQVGGKTTGELQVGGGFLHDFVA